MGELSPAHSDRNTALPLCVLCACPYIMWRTLNTPPRRVTAYGKRGHQQVANARCPQTCWPKWARFKKIFKAAYDINILKQR